MQSPPIIIQNPVNTESKAIHRENYDGQVPPPSYSAAIYKLDNFSTENADNIPSLPPSYADVSNMPIVYINNYTDPPLQDGIIMGLDAAVPTITQPNRRRDPLIKKFRLYLLLSGSLLILYGIIVVSLQIGLLASHAAAYYYYGFWAGAVIISVGIATLIQYKHVSVDSPMLNSRSFLWQFIFVAIVFGFGIIIIVVGKCDDEALTNDNACKGSFKVLNSLLVAVVALALLHTVINTVISYASKRRRSWHTRIFD